MPSMHKVMLTAIVLGSGPIAAQAPSDTLPFRRGQWGVQFRPSTDAAGLGALRFRNRSSAWVVDVRAYVNDSWTFGGGERRSIGSGGDFRAGLRRYRLAAPRVARFFTIGGTGGYTVNRQTSEGYPDQQLLSGSVGVYGDVGAAVFVAPYFSLGASTQASLMATGDRYVYTATPTSPRSETRRAGWWAGFGGITVLATLYF